MKVNTFQTIKSRLSLLIELFLAMLIVMVIVGKVTASTPPPMMNAAENQQKIEGVLSIFMTMGKIAPKHKDRKKLTTREGPAFPEDMIPAGVRDVVSREEIENESTLKFIQKQLQSEKALEYQAKYAEDFRKWKETNYNSYDSKYLIYLLVAMFLIVSWKMHFVNDEFC